MIHGVLVLDCGTCFLAHWVLSRRVDHHIIFLDISAWGIKNSLFWFILRISAGTNTHTAHIAHTTLYYIPGTVYQTLGGFFEATPWIYFDWLIYTFVCLDLIWRFVFTSILAYLDIFEQSFCHGKFEIPPIYIDWNQDGRAWLSPCLKPDYLTYTSHSTLCIFSFFIFPYFFPFFPLFLCHVVYFPIPRSQNKNWRGVFIEVDRKVGDGVRCFPLCFVAWFRYWRLLLYIKAGCLRLIP